MATVVDVSAAVKDIPHIDPGSLMNGLIARFDSYKKKLEDAAASCKALPLSSVRLRAPVPRPGNIDCMAVNYMEDGTLKEKPAINAFHKASSCVIGNGDTMVLPDVPATIFEGEAELAVVIGIGLNCLTDAAIHEQVPGQSIATLSEIFTAPLTPEAFLPHLLQTLVPMLGKFETSGFEPFADAWNAHNLWRRQPVEIREDDRVVLQGRCDGVDESGALNIMTPAGLEQIVSGDVSLRRV